jgi:hypothetical protein
MKPTWVSDGWMVRWHDDEAWYDYLCHDLKNGRFEVKTMDGGAVLITHSAEVAVTETGSQVSIVDVTIIPNHNGTVSGVQLVLPLALSIKCSWKPNLTPQEGMVIGDKVFRSPCLILEDKDSLYAMIPDLGSIQKQRTLPYIMDYQSNPHSLMYGVSHYKETGHVYHKLQPKPEFVEDSLSFRFYLVKWSKQEAAAWRDYRPVERFLWDRFALSEMEQKRAIPEIGELDVYAKHTYTWAFERWREVCWQQFKLNGKEVGGVVFIATAKQKPGLGQEEIWREPKSLWNQAWFCSLRSAYGYWKWGRQWNLSDWIDKAELALAFALSAPQTNGLFPGYYEAGAENRWENGSWVMSPPRRPAGHEGYVHLLDSSWTCYWLLKWYRDIRQDEAILAYVQAYIQRLLALQLEQGNFPAWVRPDDLSCSPYLMESPETAMHVMLLSHLYNIDPDPTYLQAAEKAANYLLTAIVPLGRWEDFETYWSCSKEWEGKQYGNLDARSGLYNQCNFGIYWTLEAMKELFQITSNLVYLDAGEQLLAELSLYQQIWEPDYFPVPTLGGFGVMNSDDEWNDARQSLFSLTYLDYYRLTDNKTYLIRGMWAIRAAFYMMYCPENQTVKKLYETVHVHFNEADYGFHMENFNHHDNTAVKGLGEFTIFDWGNGAACTALAQWLL